MIIIMILFCLSWEVVTSWRSQMVLQMHIFHVWVAILEIEGIKLCTRMNIKPGSSTLIFWDVNSYLGAGRWKISSREKRGHRGRKWVFFFKGHFCLAVSPERFLCPPGVTEHSLDSKEGSVGFDNPWTAAWGSCSLGVSVASVEADKVWLLAGSNGCSPLKEPSLTRSARSHPQTNELIKLFFLCSGILHSPIKLLSQSSWNKSAILLHNSF